MPRSPRATMIASARLHDRRQVGERRCRLDLGDELGPVADHRAHLAHVLGGAHERDGDELDTGGRHRLGEHEVVVGRAW